jgi:hypothetical protein
MAILLEILKFWEELFLSEHKNIRDCAMTIASERGMDKRPQIKIMMENSKNKFGK